MELTALMQGLYGKPKKKQAQRQRNTFQVGKSYLFRGKESVTITKKEDNKLFFFSAISGKEHWVSSREARFYLSKP